MNMIPRQNMLAPWGNALSYGQPPNHLAQMLAAADFDPNSIVGKMLAAQRAAEAARAAQAAQQQPQRVPARRLGVEPAESVLQRRLREAGVE